MSTSSLLLLIGGISLVSYLMLTVLVAHLFTTPRRVAPPMPPAHTRHEFKRVQFAARNDTVQLVAWYHRAAAATSAVIFVHGRDGCRGDELRCGTFGLATRMVARGMSVVMLDLRGHGESDRARLTFGRRERHDILGAVDYLLALGYAPSRIGILGASMGGAGAIAAAAEELAIGALVTDSAFADLDSLLRLQFRRLTRLPTCCLGGALLVARLLTGEQLTQHSPRQNMRRFRGRPSLVIHAAADPFVPVRHAHLLAEAGESERWITAGDRHLSSFRSVGVEYETVVTDFFARHLRPSPDRAHLEDRRDAPGTHRLEANRAPLLARRDGRWHRILRAVEPGALLVRRVVAPARCRPQGCRTGRGAPVTRAPRNRSRRVSSAACH